MEPTMPSPDAKLPADRPIALSGLPDRPAPFELVPDEEAIARLRDRLGLLGLRKLRFAGRLVPEGQRDWRLEADLGATVVQPCRVTLAPVTTRIDEPVVRRYLARWDEPQGPEVEMPEDDTAEPRPETLDLSEVMAEALALALPPYPRSADADSGVTAITEPGKSPMTDDEARPFAGLAGLRDRLKEDGDEEA
jgi:uncharacterized metal-binding protein YceD (DUF177 family)